MKKVYSASITPLTEEGRIEATSLDRLIEFDIERGIDGFFLLGTAGEWFALSASMKRELVGAAVEAASGRAEIFVAGYLGTPVCIVLAEKGGMRATHLHCTGTKECL